MKRAIAFAVAVLAIVLIGGYITSLNNSQDQSPSSPTDQPFPGYPGSWNCIQHFGDQSHCK